jgi:hypothetical protein
MFPAPAPSGGGFLSYARPHLGRDHGTARTGLKWVVSAAGHKYLASVFGGNIKARNRPTSPGSLGLDGRK